MRLKLILGALLTLIAPMMRAQFLPSPPGISCTQGATQSVTTGLSSTGYQLSEFPSCTVTVYNRGTITLSTIYTNSTGTPLSNPYQAPTNGLPAFYAAAGHYDVTVSQAGMLTTTFPDVNLVAEGGGGSGCGPLTADASSTNCGNGNQEQLDGTTVQTFGYNNLISPSYNAVSGAIVGANNVAGAASLTDFGIFGNNNLANTAHSSSIISLYLLGGNIGNNVTTGLQVSGFGVNNCNFPGLTTASLTTTICEGDNNVYETGLTGAVTLQDTIGLGDGNLRVGTGTAIDALMIGDGNMGSLTGAMSLADVIGLGNGNFSRITSGTFSDILSGGDGSASIIVGPGQDWVGIGDEAIGNVTSTGTLVDNLIGIGNGPLNIIGDGVSEIIGIGDAVAARIGANTANVIVLGQNKGNNLGANSSDVIQLGRATADYGAATMTNIIHIGIGQNDASNQVKIGDPTITSLKLYGSGDGCLSSLAGVVTGSGSACGSGGGGGTVTNIATTAPLGGGPITTTGTLTCTTCVVASSPGVGIAHFAGSTQTVTSSAVNLATVDVTGNLAVTNLNSGTSASSSTFWRGDGTWATPAGGGGSISGQTPGYAIEAATSTTATGPFPLDDQITTSGYATLHENLQIAGTGPSNGMSIPEAAAITGASGVDSFWADATNHRLMGNDNATGAGIFTRIAAAGTPGSCLGLAGNGIDLSPASAACGSVTSVGLSLPSSVFSVSGSPVTASGTLNGALQTQTANLVWAGPTTGSAATPTFRALVAADLTAAATYPSVDFNVGSGIAATPFGLLGISKTPGTISHCKFITTTSDASVNFVFNVKYNGTNILSGTNAAVTAGTTQGTIWTYALTTSTITITPGQLWELDVTTGAADWEGVVSCY